MQKHEFKGTDNSSEPDGFKSDCPQKQTVSPFRDVTQQAGLAVRLQKLPIPVLCCGSGDNGGGNVDDPIGPSREVDAI